MENAKGNLDRMECYTSSDLAKMVEIIQAPVRDCDVSFVLYLQTDTSNGESPLVTVAVSRMSLSDSQADSHGQSPAVGFRHSQTMGSTPRKLPCVYTRCMHRNSTRWRMMRCKQSDNIV